MESINDNLDKIRIDETPPCGLKMEAQSASIRRDNFESNYYISLLRQKEEVLTAKDEANIENSHLNFPSHNNYSRSLCMDISWISTLLVARCNTFCGTELIDKNLEVVPLEQHKVLPLIVNSRIKCKPIYKYSKKITVHQHSSRRPQKSYHQKNSGR